MTPGLQCLYQAPLSYSVTWKPFFFPSQLKADSLVPLHHSPSFTLSFMLVLLLCLQPCPISHPTSGYPSLLTSWRFILVGVVTTRHGRVDGETQQWRKMWFGTSYPGWNLSWDLSNHWLPFVGWSSLIDPGQRLCWH